MTMADKKLALQKEFERLYGDVDKLFKPIIRSKK